MALMGGQTDRACGDSKKCMGREPPRRKRELDYESLWTSTGQLEIGARSDFMDRNNFPKRRIGILLIITKM